MVVYTQRVAPQIFIVVVCVFDLLKTTKIVYKAWVSEHNDGITNHQPNIKFTATQ
jgi:hypothetical protein